MITRAGSYRPTLAAQTQSWKCRLSPELAIRDLDSCRGAMRPLSPFAAIWPAPETGSLFVGCRSGRNTILWVSVSVEVQAIGQRNADQYGRKLRILVRSGRSLDDILVSYGPVTLGMRQTDVMLHITMWRPVIQFAGSAKRSWPIPNAGEQSPPRRPKLALLDRRHLQKRGPFSHHCRKCEP